MSDTVTEPVRWQLRVRYHECDPQGVVFNANYIAYADMAVFEFWRAALGGYAEVNALGCDSAVIATEARYFASAHYDDVLDIEGYVSHIGTTSFAYAISILRAGELLTTVKMTSVFLDLEKGGKREPPEPIRAALVAYLRDADDDAP